MRVDELVLVFALVVWSLTSVIQAWHPIWTTGTAVTVASLPWLL